MTKLLEDASNLVRVERWTARRGAPRYDESMSVTLKAVNDELAKRGYTARLAKAASGYFYFQSGEAADWLDRTVNVPTVNSLTLAEWVAEFERLRTGFPSLYPRTIKVNAEIIGGGKGGQTAPKRKQTKVNR
jgi:hypothetical protein